MIELQVNGEPRVVDEPATVDALVDALACGRRGVAVAVNSDIVARSAWTTTELHAGDRVEVLQAVQGG
ncbi:MAG TPA: sulfur carrier protein ThiS [Acidimicrobiales bacterium]|nr:sulfur carrier protein ThiS [Acidimicrobiales bacterium]